MTDFIVDLSVREYLGVSILGITALLFAVMAMLFALVFFALARFARMRTFFGRYLFPSLWAIGVAFGLTTIMARERSEPFFMESFPDWVVPTKKGADVVRTEAWSLYANCLIAAKIKAPVSTGDASSLIAQGKVAELVTRAAAIEAVYRDAARECAESLAKTEKAIEEYKRQVYDGDGERYAEALHSLETKIAKVEGVCSE